MQKHPNVNYVQLGRTLLEIQLFDPVRKCSFRDLFCGQAGTGNKVKTVASTLAYDGEEFFPEEFLPKK